MYIKVIAEANVCLYLRTWIFGLYLFLMIL